MKYSKAMSILKKSNYVKLSRGVLIWQNSTICQFFNRSLIIGWYLKIAFCELIQIMHTPLELRVCERAAAGCSTGKGVTESLNNHWSNLSATCSLKMSVCPVDVCCVRHIVVQPHRNVAWHLTVYSSVYCINWRQSAWRCSMKSAPFSCLAQCLLFLGQAPSNGGIFSRK